ncbi:helix-turn-helix transcriptional regulator [Clostridium sp. WILCCON 0269]|uniref:Helix-turn-helix transcriptional regulator n=1 Tax=Candidatus Clostridium eludens TaxID=3381663 RepID=A0ABW8SP02_9CLOT
MGFLIREYRKKIGITTSELAKVAGYSRSYVNQLENGSKRPSFKALEKIAPHLNVCMKDLICGCKNKGVFPDKCQDCCKRREYKNQRYYTPKNP